MKLLIVLFAACAVTLAIPIEQWQYQPETAIVDYEPAQVTQLKRVDSPLTVNDEEPIAIADGSAAEQPRELIRPKRFLLLKKLALAKVLGAGALGVGALGVGAIALKGGLGGGGGGGSSYGGNGYSGYGGSGYGGSGWNNGGWGGNSYGGGYSNGGWGGNSYGGYGGNGYHKTVVVWD